MIVTGTRTLPVAGLRLTQIGARGLAMYWVVFGIMSGAAIIIASTTFFRRPSARAHSYCSLAILCTAATAYLAMAMQGGFAYTRVYSETNAVRTIYYARYVDWFITTPLLLLDILLLTGCPIATTLWILFADEVMILAGLFGAVLSSRYKWGWFGIGCAALLVMTWGVLINGPRSAFSRSKKTGGVYTFLALYLCGLWWVYPVTWGLAEGSNKISSNAEAIWYGCLDIMTKPVFAFLILLLGEPVSKLRHVEEEAEWGTELPSLLASPTNAPLLGAWHHNGPLLAAGAAGSGAGAAGRRVAPKGGVTEAPVAETPVGTGVGDPAVGTTTAHPGPTTAVSGGNTTGITGHLHEAGGTRGADAV